MQSLSWQRLWGLIVKEFRQLKRDHSTFAIVISLPIVQLLLFGFAINTNPKHLPTGLINLDRGQFSQTLIHQLQNTEYFAFNYFPTSEKEADDLMKTHQVLFNLTIPSDFSHQLVRGKQPSALLEVDGTDPVSVAYAVSASNNLMPTIFQYDLKGLLSNLQPQAPPAFLRVHTKYNPSAITQYNIVPGLLGTVLTMTFVMVTAMALTRERERGTMESLLMTPILPIEVMIGKATPFLLVGYIQVFIVILMTRYLFNVPMVGDPLLLLLVAFPFILANLAVGITISTFAKTQLEASQMSIFFFLPSMLLSGFAFPYYGLPLWAKWIADVLPLTHFINIIRGIMLKGISWFAVWHDLWQILVFMIVMLSIALKLYRKKLD